MSVSRTSVCFFACLIVASAFAQQKEKDDVRPPGDIVTLDRILRRRDVQQELKMTALQYEAVRRSQLAASVLLDELTRKRPSLNQTQIDAAQHQFYVARVSAAASCLSDEQLLRLEQLRTQYQLLALGPTHLLASSLELTEEQQRRVSELETELAAELRELMWNLHRRVQRELVGSLTIEQQMKWRSCVGSEFEFTPVWTGLTTLQGLTRHIALPDMSPEQTHMTLMNRSDVQKELELVDDQLTVVFHGREEASSRLRDLVKQGHSAAADGNVDEVRRLTAEILEDQRQLREARAKLRQELLLPHQLERLDELVWQYRSIPEPVRVIAEAVGLSERRREQLSLQGSDLCSLITEELWDFHRTAQRRILESLTQTQQVEWKRQLGEEFKFQPTTETFQILRYLR